MLVLSIPCSTTGQHNASIHEQQNSNVVIKVTCGHVVTKVGLFQVLPHKEHTKAVPLV